MTDPLYNHPCRNIVTIGKETDLSKTTLHISMEGFDRGICSEQADSKDMLSFTYYQSGEAKGESELIHLVIYLCIL